MTKITQKQIDYIGLLLFGQGADCNKAENLGIEYNDSFEDWLLQNFDKNNAGYLIKCLIANDDKEIKKIFRVKGYKQAYQEQRRNDIESQQFRWGEERSKN